MAPFYEREVGGTYVRLFEGDEVEMRHSGRNVKSKVTVRSQDVIDLEPAPGRRLFTGKWDTKAISFWGRARVGKSGRFERISVGTRERQAKVIWRKK